MSKPPKVVIIGAGIAGIKAAIDLTKNKDIEVEVYEAKDRIGGRLYTDVKEFNVPVEIGGAWIHGCDLNPITDIALSAGCQFYPTDDTKVLSSDGSPLPSADPSEMYDLVWKVLDKIKAAHCEQESASVSTAHSVYQYLIDNAPELLEEIPVEYRRSVFKYVIEMQNYYATYWEDVAVSSLGVDHELEGSHVVLDKGYTTVLQHMIESNLGKDYTNDLIKLNHIVTEIDYSNDGIIKAKFLHNGLEKTIEADAVLVTVPLGVLKANSIVFKPELPYCKREAIKRLGYGVFDKLFVEFDQSLIDIWPKRVQMIQVVPSWDDDWDNIKRTHFYDQVSSQVGDICPEVKPYRERDQKHSGYELVYLEPILKKPMLAMLFYGVSAEYVESIADDQEALKAFAKDKLESAFQRSLPNITKTLATQWKMDPFSRGSYANIPLGASGGDMDLLAEPVNSKIYFAGEATFRKHYSTVHGAYLSGEREAERIKNIFYPPKS